MKYKRKPDWAPEKSGDEFASQIINDVPIKDNINNKTNSQKGVTVADYVKGVRKDNRSILARAITLIESNSSNHINKAQEVLKKLLPYSGKSIRIGITGAPGVGKSTFIESFGSMLCDKGHKVAVLAIDPSSSRSKGSILGDKTRMEKLSRYTNAFIRPSPSGGALGGVARKTRESILLCEAAGFDIIIIETIGVGQSEIAVRSMVDFYMLLILPGGGDELQGIKKGVVELADLLVINKADGGNFQKAEITQHSYSNALHYLRPATEGWSTEALLTSAINDEGIVEVWNNINKFVRAIRKSGIYEKRRREQQLEWVYSLIDSTILNKFYSKSAVSKIRAKIDKQVLEGKMTTTEAVNLILEKGNDL